ncbi:hypothetical protein ACFQZQ_13170 [Lysobacter koreensis]|uniref:Uncharacterized protein n=1 Tax=Lysobacter koreensis TaxID=266122 RepID=A0ABW2YPC2_9GAMM
MAEVNAGIERYCRGTDKQLAALRSKYATRPDVLSRLDRYDATIEAD